MKEEAANNMKSSSPQSSGRPAIAAPAAPVSVPSGPAAPVPAAFVAGAPVCVPAAPAASDDLLFAAAPPLRLPAEPSSEELQSSVIRDLQRQNKELQVMNETLENKIINLRLEAKPVLPSAFAGD